MKNSQKALDDFGNFLFFFFGKYSQQKIIITLPNVLIIIGLCTCFPRVWVDFGGGVTRLVIFLVTTNKYCNQFGVSYWGTFSGFFHFWVWSSISLVNFGMGFAPITTTIVGENSYN